MVRLEYPLLGREEAIRGPLRLVVEHRDEDTLVELIWQDEHGHSYHLLRDWVPLEWPEEDEEEEQGHNYHLLEDEDELAAALVRVAALEKIVSAAADFLRAVDGLRAEAASAAARVDVAEDRLRADLAADDAVGTENE